MGRREGKGEIVGEKEKVEEEEKGGGVTKGRRGDGESARERKEGF
jgi:hypothetical protein